MACVFLLRLPSALLPRELAVDESQLLSEAMKYMVDPRPWKAIDGGTSGPVNSLFISAFLFLGFEPSYILVHMLASLLVCSQLLVAYFTLRRLVSDKAALLGVLPLVLVFGFYTNKQYLHYNTELLPTLLLMLAFYVFLLLEQSSALSSPRRLFLIFVGGLAVGTAPWCKVQAAPLSAALGLLLLISTFRARDSGGRRAQRAAEVMALSCGAALMAGVILTIVVESGATKDFWYSYVLNNIAYAGKLRLGHMLGNLLLLIVFTPVHLLLLTAVLGIGVCDYASPPGEALAHSRQNRWALAGLLVYAGVGLYTACRATHFWPKDMFFIPPMTYLAAVLASMGVNAWTNNNHVPAERMSRSLLSWLGLFLLGCMVALCIGYGVRYVEMVRTIHDLSQGRRDPNGRLIGLAAQVSSAQGKDNSLERSLADSIGSRNWAIMDYGGDRIVAVLSTMRNNRPIRTVSVWGWVPSIYVLSNTISATRESATFFEIDSGDPYRNYFRARYLADLRGNPPDLFIDAVVQGANMWGGNWTEDDGYESDPDLRKFIDDNYVLVDELTLQPGAKPVRFFARRTAADTSSRNAT